MPKTNSSADKVPGVHSSREVEDNNKDKYAYIMHIVHAYIVQYILHTLYIGFSLKQIGFSFVGEPFEYGNCYGFV